MHATIDHVAVAVPDLERAEQRWVGELGATRVAGPHANRVFTNEQVVFANGARLELLQPTPDAPSPNFVRRYLDRFGAGIQHVTLLVDELRPAVQELRDAGFEAVDVHDEHEHWHEAFLRPSQVGGLVVQVAWTSRGRQARQASTAAAAQGPALLGPTLRHPDLEHARRLWALLGAQVEGDGDHILASWADAPLSVVVERGEPAGPIGLRFADAPALDSDPELGAAVLPRPALARP
ncbi:MAG TPA: VOC family protein [Nitriliruptorales bacterium]